MLRESTYAERLEKLTKIGLEINTTPPSPQALESIAKHIAELVGARRSLFLLWDENGRSLKKVSTHGYPPEQMKTITIQEVRAGMSGWVRRTGEAVLVADNQTDPRNKGCARKRSKHFNTGPVIITPLTIRGKVIGTLTATNQRGDPYFTPEDLQLLTLLGDFTARVLENTRLYEAATRRERLLTALDKASRHIRAEKELPKLLQEILRLAAELIGYEIGGLFVNNPELEQLNLSVTYHWPLPRSDCRLRHGEGLVGKAAKGVSQQVDNYSAWAGRKPVLEQYGLKTAVAVPLKRTTGTVDAVLFLASTDPNKSLVAEDLDILERFAAQATLAYQTAQLINREQRVYGQLTVLHKISAYFQASRDLDQMLHVVLTGVTAGYGLCFNRAALLLLDEGGKRLNGRLGIGHLDKQRAYDDWQHDWHEGLDEFEPYLARLGEGGLPETPISERIRGLSIWVKGKRGGILGKVLRNGRCHLLEEDQLDKLPNCFARAFEPTSPLIIVPLMARGQAIGLLIADNKFTDSPITPADIETLTTFANTAAVAIDNITLFDASELARQRLKQSYKAGTTLVSSQAPEQILQDIVHQAHASAEAMWVTLLLIDKIGQIRKRISTYKEGETGLESGMRPNGYSIAVMETGDPVIINNTAEEAVSVNESFVKRGVGSALCLPLSLQGERLGVMWLHFATPRQFSTEEIEAHQLYVNQAAIAYDSAHLIEELRYMRQAAESLAQVAGLPNVLRQIVDSAKQVLQADSAFIWSYDAAQGRFTAEHSAASAGVSATWWQESLATGPREGGTAFTVIERGWVPVQNTHDLQKYPFLGGATSDMLRRIGAKSFQGVVLGSKEEPLGVLYVNYKSQRYFSEAERETAETFAHHATLALRKAKLLEQRQNAQKTAGVVAGVMALEDLDKTLLQVAKGTMRVIGCDAVTVYAYIPEHDKLSTEPTVVGLNYPDRVSRLPEVELDSVVRAMLEQDEPLIVARTAEEPLFGDTRFVQEEDIKSCVAIPLIAGETKVGVMFVNFRREHLFTDVEMADIRLFGDQTAVAIRNAQLFEQLQERLSEANALQEVALKLTAASDLTDVLNEVMGAAMALTNVTSGNILLWDDVKEDFTLTLKTNDKVHLQPYTSEARRTPDGRARHIMASQEPIAIADAQLEPDFNPNFLKEGYRASLGVPLKIENRSIGVLYLRHKRPHKFTERQIELAKALASQAAVAIHNAQLYQQLKERLDEANVLKEVALKLTAASELYDVLNQVMQEAMHFTNIKGGNILLWDDEAEEFTITLKTNVDGQLEPYKSKARSTADGRARRIMLTKRPKTIVDARLEPNFNPAFLEDGFLASLGVPLVIEGKAFGVLYLRGLEPYEFTERQIAVVEALGSQTAVAIDRARRHEELKAIKGFVGSHTVIDWIQMVSTSWGHNIRREVGTARALVALVRNLFNGQASAEISRELDQLDNILQAIKEIPITAPLTYEDATDWVSINHFLQTRLKQLWRHSRYKTVAKAVRFAPDLDQKVAVWASPEWLYRGLEIVLDNAIWAMRKEPHRQITISTQLINDKVQVIVEDTGSGIPEEVSERLFEKPIPKEAGSRGSGIGLLLAKTIFQTYQGDICVLETNSMGTQIGIILPAQRLDEQGRPLT